MIRSVFPVLIMAAAGLSAAPVPLGTEVIGAADLAVVSQSHGELRVNASVDGNPLTIAGKTWTTGLGTHAASEIPVTVPEGAGLLTGSVGVDDEAGAGKGSVRFRILSGDAVLWESPEMRAGDEAVKFAVRVNGSGIRKIYLQSDDLGNNASDHADWAGLEWKKASETPKALQAARSFTGEEFGIHAGDTNDQSPAFQKAIAALRNAPGSTLTLEKGEYHFHAEGALKRHFHISNHDQPTWQPTAIPLVDLHGATIDGQGSTFVFHGIVQPVLVMDSENVTVRGVGIDYEPPHHAQGIVTKTGAGFYEMTVDNAAFPHEVNDKGWLTFTGENWAAPDGGWGIVFDGKTGEIVAGTGDYSYKGKLTVIEPGKYRVEKDVAKAGIKPGDALTFRQGGMPVRPHPAITLYRAKDTVLENDPIHSSHGMGVLAQRSENIRITGGGVHPREGSGRYFSTNADATHFSNCKGTILAENGVYSGMMDDAINVHCTCLRIMEKTDPSTIRCKYMHGQSIGFEIALPGESLRFIKAKTLTDGETRKIVSIRRIGANEAIFTFDRPVPGDVIVGDAVENSDWQPSVVFRGNLVKNNRARGALFTTNKPVLVENNRFEDIAGSAILLAGDANGWFESGACRDVTIRKNKFVNNLTSRFQFTEALIVAYPEVPDLNGQTKRYHANVRITENEFTTFDVPLVYAISTDGITFSGNKIRYNSAHPSWNKPPFIFKGCERVLIVGNSVSNPPPGQKWPN